MHCPHPEFQAIISMVKVPWPLNIHMHLGQCMGSCPPMIIKNTQMSGMLGTR